MNQANVKKEFGAAVRANRLRLGLSQETLAERARLHRTYVTDVERGARNISLESISRLAAALDLSISSLFSPERPRRATQRSRSETDARDVDILLVEDDPADVELTMAAFATARLRNQVEVVRDGEAALDFLFQRGTYSHRKGLSGPLVVLLDLHLPKVHGLEVLQRLRSQELTQKLQVVVLTNSSQDSNARQAIRLGARAYIVKPLSFHSFSAVTPQLNFSWLLHSPPSASSKGARSAERA
jgi:CheY-like chemotaxis protein